MTKVELYDPTLRDGNHALGHRLGLEDISAYCRAVDACGLYCVEVGHGNGLGASSLQLGLAPHSDEAMLSTAREALHQTRLGIHAIPGFAKIDHLHMAIEQGVDVLRIACHCTEADTTARYIEFVKSRGAEAQGVLMMTHMASARTLLEQARLQVGYGADAIVLMDSAGAYMEQDAFEKVSLLAQELPVPIGFHGHNNLGLAVANSLSAARAGARLLDGTINGLGAGAGNTPLEVLGAALMKLGLVDEARAFAMIAASEQTTDRIKSAQPHISAMNIVSGLYGVFSGFEKPVLKAAQQHGVEAVDIYRVLGKRRVVAGQEDLIIEVAMNLAKAL
ncbi:4-hydroxy-2-oxovalerate aldolase [Pseudomonas protegens]|uniref:4-hydroxy-2-oxovalerate aldolase n=1 Tax=Pseudomonas protegens TaxID=380021 RepID=UPI000F4BC13E|nr:4-hydroxy-2-oxovalerate aldolase [Pseudomonas protegens]ROL68150.1 4-hydroxy-2-oxovalerate aldolase [Pseudomonas protegens]